MNNNELIKVDYSGNKPAVSARELHEFLEVKTAYKDWFPRMCEYGFAQGVDFNLLKNERVQMEGSRTVSRTVDDAAITIDMAKEICMLQRNEKGKMARQYFLQLERDWNSPEKIMARALQVAQQTIENKNRQIADMQPKALFADSVAASSNTILIGELSKILRQNGADMGEKRLFAWLRDNGYLIKRNSSDYNMPTQRSIEMGLFRIKETVITHSDGHTTVNKTTKVTGKGTAILHQSVCRQKGRVTARDTTRRDAKGKALTATSAGQGRFPGRRSNEAGDQTHRRTAEIHSEFPAEPGELACCAG